MKNMKDTNTAFEKLKTMRLSGDARTRIREELSAYADFHAAPEGVRVEQSDRSIGEVPQRTSFIKRLFGKKTSSMTATILALLLIGGGTSYAAEGAVPGDTLYPIKTQVNENIQSAFAFSNKAEAQLQARLAEERLEEAETLAARGELNADASAELRERLAAHYGAAQQYSERAEEEGDSGTSAIVRATLDGMLRGHATILAQIDANAGSNSSADIRSGIAEFARTVGNDGAATETAALMAVTADGTRANAGTEAEAHIDQSGVQAVITRASVFSTDVEEKLVRAQSKLSGEAYARLRTQMDEVADVQARAQAAFREENYQVAYTQAQSAIRIAAEVQSMLGSALRLDIDIGGVLDGNIQGGGSAPGQSPANGDDDKPTRPPQEDDGYQPIPPRETDSGTVQPMNSESDKATETDERQNSGVEAAGGIEIDADTSAETSHNGTEVNTGASTEVETRGNTDINF